MHETISYQVNKIDPITYVYLTCGDGGPMKLKYKTRDTLD